LKNIDADANAITSDFGNFGGMPTGPTARHAMENLLGRVDGIPAMHN
jgi:hypothetical protein